MNFILLLLLSVAQVLQPNVKPKPSEIRLMTFNIRLDVPSDGVYAWNARREMVYDVIRKYNPSVFGVQEVLPHQMDELLAALPGYAYVGGGRDDGMRKGEFSAIFYNKSKYKAIKDSTFWLSETPDVPGSKSWNTAITRICTWAVFEEIQTRKQFTVFNTHFDHISEWARRESALLIKRRLLEVSNVQAAFMMGDFNSTVKDSAYNAIVSDNVVLDSRVVAGKKAKGPDCTFGGFPFTYKAGNVIDFIFYVKKENIKPKRNEVIDYNIKNAYPSDHLPVLADFEF